MSLAKSDIVNSARTVKIERNMKPTLGTNKMATEFEGHSHHFFCFLFRVFVVLMYIYDLKKHSYL